MAASIEFRNRQIVVVAAVMLLACGTYANALWNGLVWDDPIVLDRQLRAFRTIGDVFFPPRDIPQFSPDYYRPLTTLSYLVDRALGGSGPFAFHLSVVVYHVAASTLVFAFGRLALAGTPLVWLAAGLGAALFAVHPIHSESVAWGAGRSDVIACVFALAGAVVYLGNGQRRLSRSALAAVLVFLGALAKETATVVLALLPASDFLLQPTVNVAPARRSRAERRRQTTPPGPRVRPTLHFVPFLIAAVAYLLLRSAALDSVIGSGEALSPATLYNLFGAITFYLSKLTVPMAQSAYVSDVPSHPFQLLGCVAALAGIGVALWMTWQRRQPAALLLLWIVATVVPSLAIVLKIPSAPVAERYLYIPSVGFCLLLGNGFAVVFAGAATQRARLALAVGAGLLISTATVATVRRNAVWRSNLSLWEDTARKNTIDGLPLRSLAAAYLEQGNGERARELFLQALQRRNNSIGQYTIYNNLGSLAMQRKQYDEAERNYRKALDLNTTADGLYNFGLIPLTRAVESDASHEPEWKREQARQARDLLLRAAQLSPHDPDIQVALGQALQALDDKDTARAHYQQALEMQVAPGTAASLRKLLEELR